MNTPNTAALGLALCLVVAGCDSTDIPLAQVPPDATEKVLKTQTKPAKPLPLPPQNQMSKGQPY